MLAVTLSSTDRRPLDGPHDGQSTLRGRNSYSVRTNPYAEHPTQTSGPGSMFATSHAPDGTPIHTVHPGRWTTRSPEAAAADLLALFATAGATPSPAPGSSAGSAAETDDAGYGPELSWALAEGGEIRISRSGTHVRVLEADGTETDDGAAYWSLEEWAAAGPEVLGAILGAAAGTRH